MKQSPAALARFAAREAGVSPVLHRKSGFGPHAAGDIRSR
jgi:hypothetical protein